LTGWNNSPAPASSLVTPTLTRSVFTISGTPTDTFLNAGEFGADNRGVVFVNGFNIGRFSGIGPTKTMYIPAPLLQSGRNTVMNNEYLLFDHLLGLFIALYLLYF